MKNFFLVLHWIMIATFFAVSVFLDRAIGMLCFSVVLVWEAYTCWILPKRLFRQTVGTRLSNRHLRESLQSSPLGVHRLSADLRTLKTEWPTPLLLSGSKRWILIPEVLIGKLDDQERTLFMDWCHRCFEEETPSFGIKFYSYSRPLLWLAGSIDNIIQTLRPSYPSLETFTYKLLLKVFYPLNWTQKKIVLELAEKYSLDAMDRLERKIGNLSVAHGQHLPSKFGFLTLKSQYVSAMAPKSTPRKHRKPTKGFFLWKTNNLWKPTSQR